MPRNGNGDYTLPQAPFVPGTTISSTSINSDYSDIASALTGSIAADGQTPVTGPLTFLDGTASTPSVSFTTNTDDGIFHPSSGQVGISLGGTQEFTFAAPDAATGSGLLGSQSSILVPIGIVQDFAGSSAPTGWLLCYGQSLSRATYPELFDVIGTTYGNVDGSSFNLPDCRGRVGVGKTNMGGTDAANITSAGCGIDGTTLGANGGAQSITLDATMLPVSGYSFSGTVSSGTANKQCIQFINNLQQAGGGSGTLLCGSTGGDNGFPTFNITPSGNVTVPTGGNGHRNVQPTIIFNKIIFAGHP